MKRYKFIILLLIIVSIIGLIFNNIKPDETSILQLADLINKLEYDYMTTEEFNDELNNLDLKISEEVIENLRKMYIKDKKDNINVSEIYSNFPPDARVYNPTEKYDSRLYMQDGCYYIKVDDLYKDDLGFYPILFMGQEVLFTEWDIYGQKSVEKKSIENINKYVKYRKEGSTYKVIYESVLTKQYLYVIIDTRIDKVVSIEIEKGS